MTINCQFPPAAVTGVILAGGRGSRMGGEDKGLIDYHGKPLYQHVLERLRPQTGKMCISANRNIAVYQQSGLPVIGDSLPDFPGPLAGMLTALDYIDTEWAIFSSCDTPALPADIVLRLWQAKQAAPAVWARSAGRDHPTLALLHVSLAEPLAAYLAKGERKVMLFLDQAGGHSVPFDDCPGAFANINRPEDLLS
ncbi:molybdenum cofactor guanylyltransferase MobA [Pantoea sp. BAV 3049]|uniref:molybdenum cofactor guanylyltransferase MobA n=1 Tax=Pantoea sp. BAV 3049 TaxID=2654188 RepID=UPI00131DC525|nr:molybdenum cofactor guanylyltransferase MobA [Pantoea sp. BAV 3049]